MASFKPVADMPLPQLTLTLNLLTLNVNPNLLHKQCAAHNKKNKHKANDLTCSRMLVIAYVLNADSGRQADVLTGCTVQQQAYWPKSPSPTTLNSL